MGRQRASAATPSNDLIRCVIILMYGVKYAGHYLQLEIKQIRNAISDEALSSRLVRLYAQAR